LGWGVFGRGPKTRVRDQRQTLYTVKKVSKKPDEVREEAQKKNRRIARGLKTAV
jgi:hypothetical protein